jgi:hypothetical protein
MAFNVENFTAIIADKGLASSNKFEVAIAFPSTGLTSILPENDLNLMCDTVSIAGKTIQSIPEIHYGVRREVAYGAPMFDALTLTFYCTEKLAEKKLLDAWQNIIVQHSNPDNGNGGNFNVAYYDTYAKSSIITVTKLSVSGEPVFTYEYREVYPKIVSAIELSHATSSGPMKVSATFNYIYWKDVTTS